MAFEAKADKVTKLIAFPLELEGKTKALAEAQRRSFSSQVIFMVQTFLEEEDKIAAKKAKRSG